jgi:hypothetical protein
MKGKPPPGKWVKMPMDALLDLSLSAEAVRLLAVLIAHDGRGTRHIWPGGPRLADMLGVDTRTVRRWKAELIENFYLGRVNPAEVPKCNARMAYVLLTEAERERRKRAQMSADADTNARLMRTQMPTEIE